MKITEIFRPLSAFQHPFVVSEPWKRRDLIDMPVTDRRGMIGRTGSDRKRSNRPILIAHLQNSRGDRDFDRSTCQRRISLGGMRFGQTPDIERISDVRNSQSLARLELVDINRWTNRRQESRGGMK